MKKVLFILLALTGIVSGYFEINEGIVTFYSDDGMRSWSMQPSLNDTTIDWIWPNIEGNVGQPITSDGTSTLVWGRGRAGSLTDGGILIGQGTDPIIALDVATNGQIPIGDGDKDPVLNEIDGNTGIDVTNGAGTIGLSFNATELDVLAWSDGSNVSNQWTFDVSGTDHTMTAGDGLMSFSHNVSVGGSTTLKNGNELRFSDVEDSHYVSFAAPALTETTDYILPDADGNANAVLTTDGGGNLEWTDPGLVYGEIYTDDNAVTSVLASQGTWYDVTIFTTNGESDGATPDHTDDSITIDSGGVYLVVISLDIRSAQSNSYYFSAFKNKIAGTELHNIEARRTTTVASKPGSVSMSGLVNFAVNDTISIAVKRTDGGGTSKSLLIEHANISILKVEDVLSGGGGSDVRVIEAHTADDTLTEAESGSIHTNLGSTGIVTLTLPANASAGTQFTFCVQEYQQIRVDPGTAAIRDNSGQAADKYKWADAIGEAITVVADSNGDWVTAQKTGVWLEEA